MKMIVTHPLKTPVPEEFQHETGRLYLLLLHAAGIEIDGVHIKFQEDNVNTNNLVHWVHEPTGEAGHAHVKCIPSDGEHRPENVTEDDEWGACIGKDSTCYFCTKPGKVVA